MKIRLFFFASLIYLLIIAALVYNLELGNYTFNIFTFSLNLPISLWIILPAFILMLLALLHMSFYGFLKHLQFKNLIKDSKNYENLIENLLLKKRTKIKFKTQEFQDIEKLTHSLVFKEKMQNEKIDHILDILQDVNEGNFVDLKKYKLDFENEITILNEKNHCIQDNDYAYSLIKNKKDLNNDLELFAYKEILQNSSYEKIKNLKIKKSQEDILSLFKRYEMQNLELSLSEIEVLLSMNDFDETIFLQIAKMLSKKIEPQNLIALFKKLQDNNIKVKRAYYYTLAEFGMFDELLNQLGNNQQEFKDFQLVLFLKEHGKKFNLDVLIQ
ncbi:hypothetical protein [Campylobacter insulaenigrae]|uniref:hypothetical protein n=1 Tax=Campylobacter insulaenigrae TaxID=260714 RepID=UPI0021523358|nr:hypothetical protein [Campylobacter insulaenigrae]MCR6571012.1 hypothetical protein [Campylobacter insulaenigrae]MCR6574492.1 hypothetical protein [Campylobacter insulaenigrae]MCR6579137.1 hypothetical protein [Campylobacter insulaenigrae]MCR6580459.1 hypothetical protein [Campylobacter insulaenigrae]MCR6583741.1 hypothetical protein [Campylobacter insulaenigrae]